MTSSSKLKITAAYYTPCFSYPYSNFLYDFGIYLVNTQLFYQASLRNFKGLSQDRTRADFDSNIRASPFNKDLSKDTCFSEISLAEQYPLKGV
jgi:hypothetical protein